MKIKKIDYHRNGVSGEGFYAVLLQDEKKNLVASVFDEPGRIAVYDVDKLAQGNIGFGVNSWRGDYYEQDLRTAIKEWEQKEGYHED